MSFPETHLDHPFDANTAVYKVGHDENGDGKMFALVIEDSKPLKISLRCDSQLAKKLREDYETVLPGQNLNKKYWNTIICSGQIEDDYLKDLVVLSYNLAIGAILETNRQ